MNLCAAHKKALFSPYAQIESRARLGEGEKLQLAALRKVLMAPKQLPRDEENKIRRHKIARLIYRYWPKLQGDCYERAAKIADAGRRRGIWGLNTWCQPTILNHAVAYGFIPKDYWQKEAAREKLRREGIPFEEKFGGAV